MDDTTTVKYKKRKLEFIDRASVSVLVLLFQRWQIDHFANREVLTGVTGAKRDRDVDTHIEGQEDVSWVDAT